MGQWPEPTINLKTYCDPSACDVSWFNCTCYIRYSPDKYFRPREMWAYHTLACEASKNGLQVPLDKGFIPREIIQKLSLSEWLWLFLFTAKSPYNAPTYKVSCGPNIFQTKGDDSKPVSKWPFLFTTHCPIMLHPPEVSRHISKPYTRACLDKKFCPWEIIQNLFSQNDLSCSWHIIFLWCTHLWSFMTYFQMVDKMS